MSDYVTVKNGGKCTLVKLTGGTIAADPFIDAAEPETAIVVAGHFKFANGEPIEFELLLDYYFFKQDGRVLVRSRHVAERDKYPSWPNPEP